MNLARPLRVAVGAVSLLLSSGCGEDLAENIFADLGAPLPSCTEDELALFEKGQAVFDRRFSATDGLGPQFNLSSCGGCHEKPTRGGTAGRYRNFLLVGQKSEDGTFGLVGKSGIQPHYTLEEASRAPTDPAANVMATRNPIPMFGSGLMAEIEEASILENVDENDSDGDGISGRSNKAAPTFLGDPILARFGRKAQVSSLEAFIRAPLFNHLGITTDPLIAADRKSLPVPLVFGADTLGANLNPFALFGFFPEERAQGGTLAPANSVDDDTVADPELSSEDLVALIGFTMLMAVPKPDELTEDSATGREIFDSIGCPKCHIPALKAPRGMIPLFSDLLVHDMGEELADGIVMGAASGSEFRTQPLWGIVAVAPYLHDGRADTLDEAIRFHGGEAVSIKEAYVALSAADQSKVIAFLESLGGKSQMTAGLLPPDAEIPAVGEYGGPRTALASDETERFREGRAAFDRDRPISEGLGPKFNGDSCRACHFLPVIGGAGPIDVNVMRHGTLDSGLIFTAPTIGTILHKESTTVNARPEPEDGSNVFEHRQTPPLFGLGLIDEIPEETIKTLADPDDLDADGISGKANVLDDSRLGRFGWKANVPALDEFSRDAMTNELGVTLPIQLGLTFGGLSDEDSVEDAEISLYDLEAVTFFMRKLGPPPRTHGDADAETRGETVFTNSGCAKCHVPSMQTINDETVNLFSDLLLHDVAPADFSGIEDGNAGISEFRTPPLWGLAKSAPYMHDGRSPTIGEAIERHESEAAAARQAYEDLANEQKADLLSFLDSL